MFDNVELPYPATYDDSYSTRRLAREGEDMQSSSAAERIGAPGPGLAAAAYNLVLIHAPRKFSVQNEIRP
jgi:hypothetical protein